MRLAGQFHAVIIASDGDRTCLSYDNAFPKGPYAALEVSALLKFEQDGFSPRLPCPDHWGWYLWTGNCSRLAQGTVPSPKPSLTSTNFMYNERLLTRGVSGRHLIYNL